MGVLGIDFGTAQVRALAASRQVGTQPGEVVAVPAVVSFDHGRVTVGEAVLMRAAAAADVVVIGLKRLLGRRPSDALARRLASRGGYALGPHDAADLALLHLEDQAHGTSAVGACAKLLRYALDCAGAKGSGHELVVAVPSWFEQPQRDALVRAAALAGLRVRRFVGSTMATALWAGHQDRLRGRVAVVDVGAGGIDVGIVHLKPGEVRLLGAAGSPERGGDDVDAELAATAVAHADRRTFELLRQACESLKRELSEADSARREVRGVTAGAPVVLSVERWELGLSVGALVNELGEVVRAALAKAGLSARELDAVVAVGGMASLAAVKEAIAASLGHRPGELGAHHGPALGAALLATALGGTRLGLDAVDGEQLVAAVEAAPAEPPAPAPPHAPSLNVITRRKEVARHRPEVVRRRRSLDRSKAAGSGQPTTDAPQDQGDASAPAGPSAPPPAAGELPAPTLPSEATPPPAPTPPPSAIEAPASPPPAAPAGDRFGGTRYPARDGHAKYPLRDRDAAPGGHAPRARRDTRPSVAPPAPTRESSSTPPAQLAPSRPPELTLPREGTMVRVTRASDVLDLAIARPLRATDLEPVAAPVLLRRVLARRSVFGTLELRGPGIELDVDIEGGAALLTLGEHNELMTIFQADELRWRLTEARSSSVPGRSIHPLTTIALEGLRRWLRTLRTDELEQALAGKRARAPSLGRKERSATRRLGLADRERRFVESQLDGSSSAGQLAALGGLGPATCYQLLALLDLYGLLRWNAVDSSALASTVPPAPSSVPPPDEER